MSKALHFILWAVCIGAIVSIYTFCGIHFLLWCGDWVQKQSGGMILLVYMSSVFATGFLWVPEDTIPSLAERVTNSILKALNITTGEPRRFQLTDHHSLPWHVSNVLLGAVVPTFLMFLFLIGISSLCLIFMPIIVWVLRTHFPLSIHSFVDLWPWVFYISLIATAVLTIGFGKPIYRLCCYLSDRIIGKEMNQ